MKITWSPEEIRAAVEHNKTVDPREPRMLVPGMNPIFVGHNCWRCRNGERPCYRGKPQWCEWPHARND